jgi:hypothetical protein
MIADGAPSQPYFPSGGLLLAIALVVTLGPLALFVPHLQRTRISARREYGELSLDYGRTFQRRWLGPRDPEKLVGTADIEPLVNLGDLYVGILDMRIIPFGRKTVFLISAMVAAPVGALVLTEWPLKDVALGLFKLLIGAPIA